jgi:hypothetical protein
MNKFFRFSGIAVLSAAFVGAGTLTAFAQDPCGDGDGQAALYTQFTELYPKTDLESRKKAIDTAKQFLEKYGACEPVKEQNDYFKKALPALEEAVKKIEEANDLRALFTRFDAAVSRQPSSANADEVYAAGKEILAKQPENINVLLALGLIGAYKSDQANNYKYSGDGLQYANMALAKVKTVTFPKKNEKGEPTAGVFWTEMTKPEATAELTYAVAYLTYFGKKDKVAALPLYYQLSQMPEYKDDARIYATIGDYYVENQKPVAEAIRVKIAEQQKADTPEERKIALEDEIKQQVALFDGYNERILDAYGRAYKVTKDTPANKAYRDNLYKIMQDVYKRRFDKDTGLDAYIATTTAKPFPNPTSAVTPVVDAEPAKATSSTTTPTTTAAPAAAAAAPANTKPAAPANGKAAVSGKKAAAGKTTASAKPRR